MSYKIKSLSRTIEIMINLIAIVAFICFCYEVYEYLDSPTFYMGHMKISLFTKAHKLVMIVSGAILILYAWYTLILKKKSNYG